MMNKKTNIVIFLIGFRGCGKTALGKIAAKNLDIPFCDLDVLFTAKFGSIDKYIKDNGWNNFREKESTILIEQENCSKIIATGGGVIERAENREFLQNQQTIFIAAALEDLIERLKKSNKSHRPRLDASLNIQDEIVENWKRRLPLYKESSSYEFVPERNNPKEKVAEKLTKLLRQILY